ncbi:MAG: hypothetical protein AAF682_06165 [Planctomycetota bacterium]
MGALNATLPVRLFARIGLLAMASAGVPWASAAAQGLSDPGARPLAAGRAAVEADRPAEAVAHLTEAWSWLGGTEEISALLIRAAAGEPDAAALWAHEWVAAAASARGKAKLPSDLRKLLGKDPHPGKVAAARASAVEELVRLAGSRRRDGAKNADELLVARWLERLALELAAESPALLAEYGEELDPRLREAPEPHADLIAALQAELTKAMANRRFGDAVRLARVLRGLAGQAGLKDLQGEAPDGMDAVEERAVTALRLARDALRRESGEPWTVAELEELRRSEGEAFTRAHHTFGRPGVAISPTGKYRVETDCGFETLLGVAKTIELHHDRLVGWYGRDPFVGRQGTVRIVPEAEGLESEGAPFWWVGGFQGGDVTTMRFAVGTIEGLGHGLTHELTHRFDGALFPGQMAWMTEGKAVWTGGAYGGSIDRDFVANHASFGTIERTWIKGYGGAKKLEELITGEIEEYRDNYFAGYALYVYLTTWEVDGLPLFAEQVEPYLAGGFRGNRNPLPWFERHFVDGKAGRPETFEAFAEGFAEFIGGFYWQDRKPWTERYTQDVPATGGGGYVYDAPTWVWSRERAEPSFGQGQARAAAELLAELGRSRDALAGFVWGLAEDGRTPLVEPRIAALCDELGRRDAAWALRATLALPISAPPEPPPFKLPRTRAYLSALRAASEDYAEEGRRNSAAALAADHDRLAARLAAEPLRAGLPAPSTLHPFDPPPDPLDGWIEDGLTGFEELRRPGLWYAADDGRLHVGRKKPREGTGTMDRAAHQRHAFTRSSHWHLPGRYRVSARVQLTTSFVDAALVLGYTRRDRNVRLGFSAGDFLYAIGSKEGAEEIESISWNLTGRFMREGALPGSHPRGKVDFGRTVSAFQLDLLVDGPKVQVFVDGKPRGTYHTPDGAPIEGYVGFATRTGAIKVHHPTVRRLDRTDFAERGVDRAFEILLNHAFRGGQTPPANGLLFLRMAQPDDEEEGYAFDPDYWVEKALRAATKLGELARQQDVLQPWVLSVSELLEGAPLDKLRTELEATLGEPAVILTYPFVPPPPPADDLDEARDEERDRDTNWLTLVDPAGVVRVRHPFFGWEKDLPDTAAHWLDVLRENGFPARELPEVPSRPEPDEGIEEQ